MGALAPGWSNAGFSFWVTLRIAARELRGGLRGFYVLITCVALGVMAIAGVNSVASGLANGLARQGATILGGDVALSLSLREANSEERTFLVGAGRVSVAATLRAMARVQRPAEPGAQATNGSARTAGAALVELKAVDKAYPLYGTVDLTPAGRVADVLAERDGAFGAAAEQALLARLGLGPGGRIRVGAAAIEIRAILDSEPDKLAGGLGFGPRLLVSEQALRASGLLRPGSVVRWHYRLKLGAGHAREAAVRAFAAAARARFPEAGWEIRSRANASPALERNVARFTQYLTLVGLTALLIGGVGVANAVKAHLDRRFEVIATLKSLGATGSRVFTVYLFQVIALAALGTVPGLLVGAALPFAIAWIFAAVLPLPLEPVLDAGDLAVAFAYGLVTAIAFAMWPLGRAHDVPASALFRGAKAGEWRMPGKRYIAASALSAAALAGLAIGLAYDRRTATIFVGAAVGAFLLLQLAAFLLMRLAQRLPHMGSPIVRLAIGNIHRPGALTPSLVVSLGLSLTLLMAVVAIDGNLRRQFLAALPERAPTFYFIDIPAFEAERFDAFVRASVPRARLEEVPMLRGRIVAANGVPAESLKPAPQAAWALQSDRGITFADTLPAGSRLVAGQWWQPGYQGPPLVSLEQGIADGLGLKLGDSITVNVLGRNLTAKIANLRAVEWQSLGINFVMVFSPNTFRGAPNAHIATLTYPNGSSAAEEAALLQALADAFPAVAALRVKDVLDTVGNTVTNIVLGIRAASVLTLIIAVLVLAGALAAGHRQRVYDAVVLKTLGATRKRLVCAYALEYFILGLSAAVVGVALGSASAAFVLGRIMSLPYVFLPWPLVVCSLCAVAATVALGLIGTFNALGQKAAPVLRNL
jgi:putative ABC transport system permease protein